MRDEGDNVMLDSLDASPTNHVERKLLIGEEDKKAKDTILPHDLIDVFESHKNWRQSSRSLV